jgi:hypothetical protein
MRRTSQQVMAEFHRLYDCFETITDCMHNRDGNYWTTGTGRHIVTRARMLEWIAEKKATPSQVLSGAQEGLNDCSEELTHMLTVDVVAAERAFTQYKSRTGRDYWEDAGHPRKQVKVILKRGRILNDVEYRLLNAWVSDTENLVLSDSGRLLADQLMYQYSVSDTQKHE